MSPHFITYKFVDTGCAQGTCMPQAELNTSSLTSRKKKLSFSDIQTLKHVLLMFSVVFFPWEYYTVIKTNSCYSENKTYSANVTQIPQKPWLTWSISFLAMPNL